MDLIGMKRLVLALGAFATLVIFLRAGGTLAALIDFHSLVFLGWCLLPLGHLWTFGRDDDPQSARIVLLAAAAMAVLFGVWVYVDVMVIHLDAQSGIAFIVVPLMQMAMVLPAILGAWILRRRARAAPARG